MLKAIGVLAILGFVFVMALGLILVSNNGGSSSAIRASTDESTPPAIPVNAEVLNYAYAQNEVAADNRFRGKHLAVFGMVQSMDKSVGDSMVLMLATGNEFEPIHAFLNDDQSGIAATLRIGQIVTADCTGGGRLLASVVLRKCSVSMGIPEAIRRPAPVAQPQMQEAPQQTDEEPSPTSAVEAARSGWPINTVPPVLQQAMTTPDIANTPGAKAVILAPGQQKQIIEVARDASSCGSAGCSWKLTTGDGQTELLSGVGVLRQASASTNGFSDLIDEGANTLVVYRFNGEKYAPNLCYHRTAETGQSVVVQIACPE